MATPILFNLFLIKQVLTIQLQSAEGQITHWPESWWCSLLVANWQAAGACLSHTPGQLPDNLAEMHTIAPSINCSQLWKLMQKLGNITKILAMLMKSFVTDEMKDPHGQPNPTIGQSEATTSDNGCWGHQWQPSRCRWFKNLVY